MVESGAERRIANRYAMRVPALGHGGMGVVWRAEDTLLGREVAIKEVRLPPTLAEDERVRIRARVMREARVAARLNHPGAVILHDIVDEDGRPFIVMELVRAPTLTELVAAEGALPPARAAAIGLGLLDTLEAAHRTGIVHRDVKPSNVMVCEDGSTKLADFGIASLQGDPAVTASGLLLGSPAYMAPEQAEQGPVGPPTDLWALGATIYFAVEGEPPFDKGGPVPTLAAVVHEHPRPMRRAGPLEPAITALLRKPPADRLTAPDLRGMLRKVVAGADGTGEGAGTATAPLAPPSERPAAAGTDAAVVAGELGAGTATAPWPGSPPAPVAPSGRRRRGRRLLTVALTTTVGLVLGLLGWRAVATYELLGPEPTAPTGDTPAPPVQGWQGYVDPHGTFTLAHPAGWTVKPGKNDAWVELIERGDTGRRFKVQVDGDTRDPLRVWEEVEADLRSRYRASYRRIALERSAFEVPRTTEPVRAAVWEFTYGRDPGGRPTRVWDLSLVTAERRYSVLFQTDVEDWASSTGLLDRFLKGLKLAGPASQPAGRG